jgi:hypothetical protein
MVKAKLPDGLVDVVDRLTKEADPTDLFILSAGFIAGYHGYTPVTSLMKLGGGAISSIDDMKQKAKNGDVVAGFELGFGLGGGVLGAGIGAAYSAFSGVFSHVSNSPDIPVDKKKEILEGLIAHLSMACIGAIEAYAITRPGTIAGIGEIAKGIGEMLPG